MNQFLTNNKIIPQYFLGHKYVFILALVKSNLPLIIQTSDRNNNRRNFVNEHSATKSLNL